MISLIIPTLNDAAALKQSLSGLTNELKQQFQVELIVSDGGSTDGTVAAANKLGAQVIAAKPGEKQNIAIGRNAGAAQARGEVLIFLDADSYPDDWSNFFSGIVREFTNNRVVAATVSVTINPAERKWRDVFWLNIFNFIFFCQLALGISMGRGNCQIVRASAFRQIGGYNESLAAAEDYDLYRRLGKLGKIKILRHITIYESPRRYRKYGYLRVAWWWLINSLWVTFRQQAWSKEWRRVD